MQGDGTSRWLRGRLFDGRLSAYVAEHRLQWEIGVGVVAAVYIAVSFVEDTSSSPIGAVTIGTVCLGVALFVEFASRYADSRDRGRYLRDHWIDLVTCIPLIGPLRALRFLRLLRFLRVGATIRHLTLGSPQRLASADNTWIVWPLLLLFWVGSAYALWIYEHGVNPDVKDFTGALYLSFLTASTVGYGSTTPITPEGKIIGGVIVFVAIGLVGLTSARLTAMWLGQKDDDVPERIAVLEQDVHAMRVLLTAIARHTGVAEDNANSELAATTADGFEHQGGADG